MWHIPVEEEAQWCATPGQVHVLAEVQVAPLPIVGVLADLLFEEVLCIDECACHVVGTTVATLVL